MSDPHIYCKEVGVEQLEVWFNETMKEHGAVNIFSVQPSMFSKPEEKVDVVKVLAYIVVYMPLQVQPQQAPLPPNLRNLRQPGN